MNHNKQITILLTVFIVAALTYLATSSFSKKTEEPVKQQENHLAIPQKGDFIQVFYFHTRARCVSCRLIEDFTKKAVEANFADLITENKISFAALNYQEAGNNHYISQFGLYMPTVVIAKYQDGKMQNWKSLNQVWNLTRDENEFITFITNEVKGIE